MNTKENPKVPHWLLRRLAPRALHVLERHKGGSVALQYFDKTLVPAATRFAELYDASRVGSPSMRQLLEGQKAVEELRVVMRGWIGHMARDIEGFNAQSFDDRSMVPDDVIGSARRLLEVARAFKRDGEPLPYAAEVEQSLGSAVEAAEKQWSDAQGQLHQHQALLAETRKAALAFNKELVAFRRSLRAVISTRDRDYRQLRITTRALLGDVVDGATGDVITEPTEPTESTSTTPSSAVQVPAPIAPSPSNGAIKEVATA